MNTPWPSRVLAPGRAKPAPAPTSARPAGAYRQVPRTGPAGSVAADPQAHGASPRAPGASRKAPWGPLQVVEPAAVDHVGVAGRAQRGHRAPRPVARGAVDDDRPGLVAAGERGDLARAGRELRDRDVDGLGQVALGELVGGAHVDHHGAGGDLRAGGGWILGGAGRRGADRGRAGRRGLRVGARGQEEGREREREDGARHPRRCTSGPPHRRTAAPHELLGPSRLAYPTRVTDDDTGATTEAIEREAPFGDRVLLVVDGAALQAVPRPGAGTLTLGRGTKCNVVIDSGSVSRHHANLRIGAEVELEDVGSSNGTTIEGVRLAANQPARLTVGVPFLIGAVTLMVQTRAGSRRPAVAAQASKLAALEQSAARIAVGKLPIPVIGETGVGTGRFAEPLHELGVGVEAERGAGPRPPSPERRQRRLRRAGLDSARDRLLQDLLGVHEHDRVRARRDRDLELRRRTERLAVENDRRGGERVDV